MCLCACAVAVGVLVFGVVVIVYDVAVMFAIVVVGGGGVGVVGVVCGGGGVAVVSVGAPWCCADFANCNMSQLSRFLVSSVCARLVYRPIVPVAPLFPRPCRERRYSYMSHVSQTGDVQNW